jgi:hypothetical protein
VVELEGAHLAGDVREGDGEGAAEAAALFGWPKGMTSAFSIEASSVRTASPVVVPRLWQERWKAMRVGFSKPRARS